MANCLSIMKDLAEKYMRNDIDKEDLKPMKKDRVKGLLQPEANPQSKPKAKASAPMKRPAAALPAPAVAKKLAAASQRAGAPEGGGPKGDDPGGAGQTEREEEEEAKEEEEGEESQSEEEAEEPTITTCGIVGIYITAACQQGSMKCHCLLHQAMPCNLLNISVL